MAPLAESRAEYHRRWRKTNSESYKASQAKYLKGHPEVRAALMRRKNLRDKYGLTSGQFEELLAEQGGRCAICDTPEPGFPAKRFHVDHDHVTGKLRGLLCGSCNVGLGYFKDRPALLLSAIAYLERNGSHA